MMELCFNPFVDIFVVVDYSECFRGCHGATVVRGGVLTTIAELEATSPMTTLSKRRQS